MKGATFVEPQVVCEVEYLEITKSTHKMRAPSFKGLREDKLPDECVLERPRAIPKTSDGGGSHGDPSRKKPVAANKPVARKKTTAAKKTSSSKKRAPTRR